MIETRSLVGRTSWCKHCLTIAVALLASLALAHGNQCSAVVIGDYESGSLDGWLPTPFQNPEAVLTSVPGVGNTLGDSSLGVTLPQGGFWGPSFNVIDNGQLASFLTATELSFDVTFLGSALGGADFAQVNEMAINDSNGSFVQRNFAAAGTDSTGRDAQWQGDDHTATITWNLDAFTIEDPDQGGATVPYTSYAANHPELTHITLWLVSQAGNGTSDYTIHFDNVNLVPEPGALALMSLCIPALIVLARRRKKV